MNTLLQFLKTTIIGGLLFLVPVVLLVVVVEKALAIQIGDVAVCASYGRPAEGEDPTLMTLEPGAADAKCDDGVLHVLQLRSESFPSRMPGDSMHVYDYSLCASAPNRQ